MVLGDNESCCAIWPLVDPATTCRNTSRSRMLKFSKGLFGIVPLSTPSTNKAVIAEETNCLPATTSSIARSNSAPTAVGDPWAHQQPQNYGGFAQQPPQGSDPYAGGGYNQPPQGGSEPPTQQVPRWEDPPQPR